MGSRASGYGIERRRTDARTGEVDRDVGYAVTSLGPDEADARRLIPADAGTHLARGEWRIENRPHRVRDRVPFWALRRGPLPGEIGRGAPGARPARRNLTIALLRRAGHENIAAALRTHAARPRAAVALALGTAAK